MIPRRYVTVDVFTNTMFGGNPLAVVLDADGLSKSAMQQIAAEFGYSETTFVLPPADPANTARVRIFTPTAEVPFAGHPNVGTGFVLADRGDSLRFEEAAGLVDVEILRNGADPAGARIAAPQALTRVAGPSPADVARCVGLAVEEIALDRHPPSVASVGLAFIVAELTSRHALRRATPDIAAFRDRFGADAARDIHLYTRDGASESVDLHARMFAPLDGVIEDPATGSANCALAGLLAAIDPRADGTFTFRIAQGDDMGRPSRLTLTAVKTAGAVSQVSVAGACVPVMEGRFFTP